MRNFYNNLSPQLTNMSFLFSRKCMIFITNQGMFTTITTIFTLFLASIVQNIFLNTEGVRPKL